MTSNGINFIDEDNARSALFGAFEQIADTTSANTDEHFNEIRAGNTIERNASFSRHCFRQKGFTGSRIADEQDAFGETGAEFAVFLRVFQIFDKLDHFRFFFIASSDIGEADLALVFATSRRFIEIEGLPVAAIDRAIETDEEEDG